MQTHDSCKDLKRIKNYKFWKDGNHPKEISTNKFLNEKVNYIHMNPVEDTLVEYAEDIYTVQQIIMQS